MKEQALKEYRDASFMSRAVRRTSWAAAALCLVGLTASGAVESPKAVQTVTAQQIHKLVADRKGKVVVVNFWATWCPPCLREFPAIIKVYEQHRKKGLDMFAVSMNSPEEMADIENFLKTHKPPFPIYLADMQDGTFSEAVLKQWYGEMPLTLVFNAAGENVLAHRKEITYEELSSKVEALLPAGQRATPTGR